MRRSLRTEATQSNREAGQSLASQKTLWCREQDQCSQKLHSPILKGSSLKHPEPFFTVQGNRSASLSFANEKGRQYAALENGREDQEEDASWKQ